MSEPVYGVLWRELDGNQCWYNFMYPEGTDIENAKDDGSFINLSYPRINLTTEYAVLDWVERDDRQEEDELARFEKWLETATGEEKELFDMVIEEGELFDDMLFEADSITGKYLMCQLKKNDNEWSEERLERPKRMEELTYSSFHFKFDELPKGITGQYNHLTKTLTLIPGPIEESDLLHEMLHLHEYVLNEDEKYYRDIVFLELYKDLKKQIPDLDERIEAHAHILNEQCIQHRGGIHDVLFLLKSFDLDLKKGYKLGTVFGYGMAEE